MGMPGKSTAIDGCGAGAIRPVPCVRQEFHPVTVTSTVNVISDLRSFVAAAETASCTCSADAGPSSRSRSRQPTMDSASRTTAVYANGRGQGNRRVGSPIRPTIAAQVVADQIRVPAGGGQQPLHAVGVAMKA
jgi:hypothetical protein